jgi:iron(III) transport system permease protein
MVEEAISTVGGRPRGGGLASALFGSRNIVRNLSLAVLVLFLAFLSLYPLAMIFYGSVHTTAPGTPGTFSLAGYRAILQDGNLVILLNTVVISFIHTLLAIIVAIVLAFIVARTDTPWRGTLEVLITLPFFVPPVLTAMAWGMLCNPQVGAVNQIWRWLTGFQAPLVNIYSYGGIIWHMNQYAIPFLFLLIVDAFRAMDPSLEEAARMSGASRWRVVRQITLTLMLPVISSACLLSFIRGVEAFESALFFGLPAHIEVITTAIYDSITQSATPQYQFATAMSFVIMALMTLLVAAQWLILRGRSFQTVTGKGYTPRPMRLGRWRWVAFGLCILFFVITVVLPIGQLAVGSFFKFFGFYGWDMVTLDHYREVFADSELWRSIRNTLFLGLTGASAIMVLGGITAYVTVRTRWRGRHLVDMLAWLPWLMPGIVMGIGLLWAYALMPGPIQIYGTIWALFFAYMALGMPLSVRIMGDSYRQLSLDLEECSRVHGANWWQTLWRIMIALAWPAFAVGWILTFFGILRELSASILLYSVGSEVLSVELVKLWMNGGAEKVSVIGLMAMLLVILFRLVQIKLLNRRIGVTAV